MADPLSYLGGVVQGRYTPQRDRIDLETDLKYRTALAEAYARLAGAELKLIRLRRRELEFFQPTFDRRRRDLGNVPRAGPAHQRAFAQWYEVFVRLHACAVFGKVRPRRQAGRQLANIERWREIVNARHYSVILGG